MKICIIHQGKAYLPETKVYTDYLGGKGIEAEIFTSGSGCPDADIFICFMGFDPIWARQAIFDKKKIIHEYVSLSTPPFARCKDYLKKHLNKQPAGRIYLNEEVRKRLAFSDSIPWIYREMGVNRSFFQQPTSKPEFDLVYAGADRSGLRQTIRHLAGLGIKILLIGEFTLDFRGFVNIPGYVFFTGRVGYYEIPALYYKCRTGLNYTPDKYPYNIQTSTKTLEYCAAGLGVVSNRYAWIENFAVSRNARLFWLEDLKAKEQLDAFRFRIPDLSDLEWNQVLDRAGIIPFLHSLLE